MPTVSFEGETQAEIVSKVRRWLASVDGEPSADALDRAEAQDSRRMLAFAREVIGHLHGP